MSSKNIFEVLQNVAENTESNEKFLNILKENGFTGTLEEAENQINQQTQVVLNNLTTEDLQNIAGGKSLMNDKLKKALAVGGASLMAAGTVMPSSLAANENNAKKFVDSALNYVEKNPVHTTITTILGVATTALLAKSIFGGKTKSGLPFTDEKLAFLWEKDLSKGKTVFTFIGQLSSDECEFEVNKEGIKFTKTAENILQEKLQNKSLSVDDLIWTLIEEMDNGNQYINEKGLTEEGAQALNILAPYFVERINNRIDNIRKQLADAKSAQEHAEKAAKTATENKERVEAKLTTAKEAKSNTAKAVSSAGSSATQDQKNAADAAAQAVTALETKVAEANTAADNEQKELETCKEKVNKLEPLAKKFDGLKLELKRGKFKVGDQKPEPKPAQQPTQQPIQIDN